MNKLNKNRPKEEVIDEDDELPEIEPPKKKSKPILEREEEEDDVDEEEEEEEVVKKKKVIPEVKKTTNDPVEEISPEDRIMMEIERLQNNGIFRAELLFQLQLLNEKVKKLIE